MVTGGKSERLRKSVWKVVMDGKCTMIDHVWRSVFFILHSVILGTRSDKSGPGSLRVPMTLPPNILELSGVRYPPF